MEDVYDNKAILWECEFSFCFYGRILLFKWSDICIGNNTVHYKKGNGIKT